MELSALSRVIPPTLSRQLFMMAKQYDDVVDFTIGDPDLPTADSICQAAVDAVKNGKTHYAPNAGLFELREVIAKQAAIENACGYLAENVAITVGATEAVYLSLMACINPDDEVIILAPYWVQYENIVKLLGAKPIIIDSFKEDFEPDINVICKAINNKTKVIILNSPNNPTGYIYKDSFLKCLAEVAIANNIIIFNDEAYRSLVYNQEYSSIVKYCNIKNVVTINSFSKQFAMTGWRVGYVIAEKDFIEAVVKLQQNVAVCVATPNQYAAIEAIKNSAKYSKEIKDVFASRCNVLVKELSKVNKVKFNIPQGTFYAFIDISETGLDSKTFSFSLLKEEHVAVIPGIAFGEAFDNYIRLSFTLKEDIIIGGINRLRNFINNL